MGRGGLRWRRPGSRPEITRIGASPACLCSECRRPRSLARSSPTMISRIASHGTTLASDELTFAAALDTPLPRQAASCRRRGARLPRRFPCWPLTEPAARPRVPSARSTSTSTVGLPRLSEDLATEELAQNGRRLATHGDRQTPDTGRRAMRVALMGRNNSMSTWEIVHRCFGGSSDVR